jgi:hypothetical protein
LKVRSRDEIVGTGRLFLPSALLVTMLTQLFAALMLIDFCLTAFFKRTHSSIPRQRVLEEVLAVVNKSFEVDRTFSMGVIPTLTPEICGVGCGRGGGYESSSCNCHGFIVAGCKRTIGRTGEVGTGDTVEADTAAGTAARAASPTRN